MHVAPGKRVSLLTLAIWLGQKNTCLSSMKLGRSGWIIHIARAPWNWWFPKSASVFICGKIRLLKAACYNQHRPTGRYHLGEKPVKYVDIHHCWHMADYGSYNLVATNSSERPFGSLWGYPKCGVVQEHAPSQKTSPAPCVWCCSTRMSKAFSLACWSHMIWVQNIGVCKRWDSEFGGLSV